MNKLEDKAIKLFFGHTAYYAKLIQDEKDRKESKKIEIRDLTPYPYYVEVTRV